MGRLRVGHLEQVRSLQEHGQIIGRSGVGDGLKFLWSPAIQMTVRQGCKQPAAVRVQTYAVLSHLGTTVALVQSWLPTW